MSKQNISITSREFLPAWSWFLLVLALICLPGGNLPSVTSWYQVPYFDKWLHMGLFGVMALLFMHPFSKSKTDGNRKKITFAYIALVVSAWGLATEFIQKYLVTGRSFELTDWAADSTGILLAWIFAIRYFQKKSNH